MSLLTGAVLAGALLVPAGSTPPAEPPTLLALNPQPEPPGKAKIKRIYTGGPDSRRGKSIKQKPVQTAPVTKY